MNRTGEAALTIEKKIWTGWQSTCYVICCKGKEYEGRIKLIEDGIMDKMRRGSVGNGTDSKEVAFSQREIKFTLLLIQF